MRDKNNKINKWWFHSCKIISYCLCKFSKSIQSISIKFNWFKYLKYMLPFLYFYNLWKEKESTLWCNAQIPDDHIHNAIIWLKFITIKQFFLYKYKPEISLVFLLQVCSFKPYMHRSLFYRTLQTKICPRLLHI